MSQSMLKFVSCISYRQNSTFYLKKRNTRKNQTLQVSFLIACPPAAPLNESMLIFN